MSLLSAKARAFSVDELLGKKEKETTSKVLADERRNDLDGDEICPLMGEEPNCRHKHAAEVLDNQGNAVKVELCQAELWQAFHMLGTEMIITKTGRRMFPAVRVRVSGLQKSSRYKISMDFIPVDKNKYRYVYHSSRWMLSGVGDALKPDQTYEHPDSPMTGEYLTSQVISFEKIKLTNHEKPGTGQISLLSMQKFQPRITIQETDTTSSPESSISVTFPQTSFIAVTAYQNQEITRLKIARNPFAKGFREAGKCRSSLEAMMASFGVVLDTNQDQYSPTGKRRFENSHKSDQMELSPPKQAMWNPPLFIDPRLSSQVVMYPPMLLSRGPLLSNVSQDISKTDDTGLSETDHNDNKNIKCNPNVCEKQIEPNLRLSSPLVSSLSSAALSQISPNPVYCQNGGIHPAFPYSTNVPVTPIDSQALAAYYKGIIQNPSYPNFMFVPSTMFPVPGSQSSNNGIYDYSRKSNKIEGKNAAKELQTS